MLPAGFDAWCRQVLEALAEIGQTGHIGGGGAMIDALIPFRLGWSPRRFARALLTSTSGDNRTLRRAAGLPEREQEAQR